MPFFSAQPYSFYNKFFRHFYYIFCCVICYVFLVLGKNLYAQSPTEEYKKLAYIWDTKIQQMDFFQKEENFEGWGLDSLEKMLPFLRISNTKCDVLNLIAERYSLKFLPKTENLLEQAYQIAQKEDYIFGKYWCEKTFAFFYQQNGNTKKGLEFLAKAEKNAEKSIYPHGIALIQRLKGQIYERQEKPVLALQAFLKGIEIHEKIQNFSWLALDYWRLSIFYYKREDYKRGLGACEKGEEYAKKADNKKALIRIYNWWGLMLEKQQQQEQALQYFDKAWKMLQKYSYPTADNERAMALYGIGANKASLFYKKPTDQYFANSALEYLDLCVSFQQQKFESVNTDTYLKIAELYLFLKNQPEAEKNYLLAKNTALAKNALFELGNIEEHLVRFYISQKNYPSAQNACKNIIKYAENGDLRKNLLTAYNTLAEIEAQNQNFKQAFLYQQKAQQTQESLNTDQDQRKVARLEIEYELSQAQKEKETQTQKIQLLQTAEIQYQKNLNQFFGFAFAVLMIMIILVLVYYQRQRKINQLLHTQTQDINKKNYQIEVQKQILEKAYNKSKKINEELKTSNNVIQQQKEELQLNTDTLNNLNQELAKSQQEVLAMNSNLERMIEERTTILQQTTHKLLESKEELETFLYNASHSLRRPLTTIMGLKKLCDIAFEENKPELKDNLIKLFDNADLTARNMDKMLGKLIMVYEIAQYKLNEDLEEIDFEGIITQIKKKYAYFATDKNLVWEVKIQPDLKYVGEELLIKMILENILENSIDFANNTNPLILVKIEYINEKLKIIISDNGQGIESANHPKIFNLYFKGNEKSKGNGLGLYVVKKVVERLQGKISFRSQLNVGTTFVIEI